MPISAEDADAIRRALMRTYEAANKNDREVMAKALIKRLAPLGASPPKASGENRRSGP